MSGREQALAEEVARQQALRWVDAALIEEQRETIGVAVEHIARLATCLSDCGVFLTEEGMASWSTWVHESDRAALADALRGARAFLDEMNADDDEEPDGPPMCPCGEPATVELAGDNGWLCEECAA